MQKTILPVLLLAAAFSHAGTIWRCPGGEDGPVFSNQPCDGAEPITLQPLGEISAMDGAKPRAEPRPSRQRGQPENHSSRSSAGPLSYGERTRWRQLRIELEGLERDLRRGQLRGRERTAAQSRINAVRQELAPLDSRARIHPPTP